MKHFFQRKQQWSDQYTKKAKHNKYPARSVYKLKEIQRKYRVLTKGAKVLDLGCAPGSWLLYASKVVGSKGSIVGIDLKPVQLLLPHNVFVVVGDVLKFNTMVIPQMKFNSVISDMAPSTTGNNIVDIAQSLTLCKIALKIADLTLVRGGTFVCKIFHGEDLKKFSDHIKKKFKTQSLFKPQSSRKSSREIYVIGLNKFKNTGGSHVRA